MAGDTPKLQAENVVLPQAPAGPVATRVLRLAPRFAPWLLLVPALLVLLGGFLVPTGFAMVRTFTDFRPPEQQGLENIVWFWNEPVMVETLIRTFAISGIATVVVSMLAYFFAYVMTIVSEQARAYLLLGVLLTNTVDLVIRNFAWIAILQRKGMINNLLGLVGLEPVQFLGTPAAVVTGMVSILFPLMLFSLYPVLSRIDRNMVLAAMSLGARPATAFWRVYFPQSLPGVFAGGLLVFTMALGFFITPALLGSRREAMLSQAIQFYVKQPSVPWGRIGAMALALVVTAGITLYISNVFQRRLEERGMS